MSAGDQLRDGIRRSWLLVVLIVAMGGAAAFAASSAKKPQYDAQAGILVSEQDAGAVLGIGGVPDTVRQGATDSALGNSTEFRRRVNDRLGSDRARPAAFSVSTAGDSSVLTVTGSAETPAEAVRIANLAAAEFVMYRGEIRTRALRGSRDEIVDQLEQAPKDPDLRQALSRLEVVLGLASQGATVADRADTAMKVSPRPARDVAIGIVAGLVVALLIVAIREGLSARVRGESDLEEMLGLPIIVTIPPLSRSERKRPSGPDFDRLALHLERLREESNARSVAVVSARAKEGRTTVVAGIAAALARRGAQVCAADIASSSPDVASLLPDDTPVLGVTGDDRHAEQPTEGSVALLAPDTRRPRALERLAPYREVLRDSEYWVLIDTPPSLGSVTAEELASEADVVLVVVRPRVIRRREVIAFARQNSGWPARMYGVVVTGG